MIALRAALAAEPGPAAWDEICSAAEGASEPDVAEAALRLRAWPYRLRRMPDRWWAQRQAGEHRPWHRLATHRLLCWNHPEGGVSALACPDDLSVLLLGTGPEGNNWPGSTELVVPKAEIDAADTEEMPEDDELPAVLATLDVAGMAWEALFSPDGSRLVAGFDAVTSPEPGLVVYGRDGQRRHTVPVRAAGATDPDEPDLPFLRLAQSRDGRLIAGAGGPAQAVAVAEVATGRVLMTAAGATGPVALDPDGRLVAYADAAGQVCVREVASGRLIATAGAGLARVNALAFAPDSAYVLAAGGADPTGERPAARVLSVADGGPAGPVVVAADPDAVLDSWAPFACWSTRASWTGRRPWVFASDDERAVLMDGSTGEIGWTSVEGLAVGAFTSGGEVFLTADPGGVVAAWFLHTLAGD
ncbi:WD40 repeat domain-containing protein [Dactylosporangium sp. CA-092794]|uniref:WD40 repeat domain-containing protein n=1 Tax=Dactylosporangium sp. CA-092794 TaxID=3239929 RepID=UPI003D8BAD08